MGGMAGTLAKLNVILALDGRNFSRGLDEAESRMQRFGAAARRWGAMLTAAVTLPIVAGFGMAVNAASDLAEAQSAVNTVYGESASLIAGYNESVAESLGLSRQEALASAATLGVYGQAAGLAGDELATFTNQNLQAAADLASFYNVAGGAPEVLNAIQGALMGEYDALQRMGVLIDEDIVNQYAWQHGIAATGAELTEQQKVLARHGVIMDGLGAAQGDFARTQGGLANQSRILRARFKDLAATVGSVLLPVALKLANAVGDLFTWLEGLSPAALKIAVIFGAVVAAVGPLLLILGALSSALGGVAGLAATFGTTWGAIGAGALSLLGPLALVAAAIAALFLAWRTNFLGIQDITADVFGGIVDTIGPPILAAIERIRTFVAEVTGFYQALRDQDLSPVEAAFTAVGNALDRLLGTDVSGFFTDLGAGLQTVIIMVSLTAGLIKTELLPAIYAFAMVGEIGLGLVLDQLRILAWLVGITLPPLIQGLGLGFVLVWAHVADDIRAVIMLLEILLPEAIRGVTDLIYAAYIAFRLWYVGMNMVGASIRTGFTLAIFLIRGTIMAIDELIEKLPKIDLPEWMDPGNINLGALNPMNLLDADPASAAGGPSGQDLTVAGVAPFENMKDGILSVMEDIAAGVANAWLGMKNDAINIVGQLNAEVYFTFTDLWQPMKTNAEQIRATVANEWVGLKNDLVTITGQIRDRVIGEFQPIRGDLYTLAHDNIAPMLVTEWDLMETDAAAGGWSIGNALGAGLYNGIIAWINPIVVAASSAVRGAITAARLEAQVTSPSRKTMYIGEMMGKGLVLGFERGVGGGSLFGSAGFAFAGRQGGSTTATFNNYGAVSVGQGGGGDDWSAMRGWRYGETRA
jgi:hypothetical protein